MVATVAMVETEARRVPVELEVLKAQLPLVVTAGHFTQAVLLDTTIQLE
jgi:hypothetical protein